MKIINAKGKSLFFIDKNIKLEIEKKINLNDFLNFFLEVYSELLLVKYDITKNKIKNKKMSKNIN